MQTVLKQFCHPVNFLTCACSGKMIGRTGIGACSKRVICKKSWCGETCLSPLVKYFYVPRQYFFCGSFVFLCHVFLMLLRLFIAALWSTAEKGLTSWLLLVMFIVFFLLSHVVSLVRCGT